MEDGREREKGEKKRTRCSQLKVPLDPDAVAMTVLANCWRCFREVPEDGGQGHQKSPKSLRAWSYSICILKSFSLVEFKSSAAGRREEGSWIAMGDGWAEGRRMWRVN